MAYILPRALIVLFAWGVTCGLINHVWPNVDPKVFYVAGASWAFAGMVCFGYLYRLRGEEQDQQERF
jgi:hypothetical protein